MLLLFSRVYLYKEIMLELFHCLEYGQILRFSNDLSDKIKLTTELKIL